MKAAWWGAREPFDKVKIGDVIWWNGRVRKVRDISYYRNGFVRTFTFAILTVSWTNRPFTTYHRSDILSNYGGIAIRKTKVCDRRRRHSFVECLVQAEIQCKNHARRYIKATEMAGTVI